jgi:dTDP-4-amino-4,6-dideoxygalactose transaminase
VTFVSARPSGGSITPAHSGAWPVPHLRHFPRGRDALAAALGEPPERDRANVVFPAFFCAPTVGPVVAAGWNVVWHDVDHLLGWSEAGLGSALTDGRVRAVVLTDFFGFRSRGESAVMELARSAGSAVIRDCCHAFLAWDEARPAAEAVVFSMRKTLPVWDGGALVSSDLSSCTVRRAARLPALRAQLGRVLERALVRMGGPNPYPVLDRLRMTRGRHAVSAPAPAGPSLPEQQPSSALARWLRASGALSAVLARRRANYQALERPLRELGFAPVFDVLASGDAPWTFPVMAPDLTLVAYLRRRGIGAIRWPGEEMPAAVLREPERFPNAMMFHRRVVGLPVHQDLGAREMDVILEALRAWTRAGTT